jgi:predicted O-methyltransferase YrrM
MKKEEFQGFESHEYRPIVRDESIEFLQSVIKKHRPKRILEVGTFIGYSASIMLESDAENFVVTLEKDCDNAQNAVKNLTKLGYGGRFEVINCDAYDFLTGHSVEQFDFIFLDGPKGQYIKYLPYLKNILRTGGILLADDILFYGLVNSTEHIEHKHRTIVNNLRKFIDAITHDDALETQILSIGNGMSVSKKIK